MYGLKQMAILTYENLMNKLASFGYQPIPNTDSYWQHKQYPTKFCLCVENFGVKHFYQTGHKSSNQSTPSQLQNIYGLQQKKLL